MNKHLKKLSVMMLLLFMTGAAAFSQVTTSGINGRVVSNANEPLPGAAVVAIHVPSGTQYGTVTNIEGRFSIQGMRPGGPYSVNVSFVGYSTGKYSDITLLLGESFSLNVTLKESAVDIGEVMIVGAKPSAFGTNKTGAATNISNEQINLLPTISRSLTDFTRITPQSFGNSFAGRDSRYNNLQIDGSNFNNAFGLSSNPLPGGASQAISLDAIEELQVSIAPYDIRQSGFTGAGINAITRSGTNTFHGSIYGFYNNQNFQGTKVGPVDIRPTDKSGNRYLLDAVTKNYGFRLGGPIIKNKLFFFINAERQDDTGANASGANLWKASQDGKADATNNIARTSVTDLEKVRQHLIDVWGYDPGRYEGYANEAKQTSSKYLARIDWNISEKHKFALRYNQVEGVSNTLANGNSGPYPRSGVNRVSESSITFENGNYSTKNIVKSLTAEFNSSFSNRFANQFLATYSRISDRRGSPSTEFPFVDIWDGGRSTSGKSEANYMSFGYELFTYKNDLINDNYSFVDNITVLTGKHTIVGGLCYDIQKFANSYVRLGTSYYRYSSVEDFLTTGTTSEVAPIMFGVTYPYEGQEPYARVNFSLASAYIQDRYAVNDRLNLTFGIRAEIPLYLSELTANQSINSLVLLDQYGLPKNYDTGSWPKSRVMMSPRIGFNYDVFGDRSLTLRGGTGIFTGRVPFVWLSNMPTNSGVLQNNVEPGSYAAVATWINNVKFNPDKFYWVNNPPKGAESVFIKTPKAGYPSSFALVDQDFRMPSVWRSSLGGDYKIPGTPLVATTDILYTYDMNAVYQYGANRAIPITRMNYGTSDPTDPGDTRYYYPTTTSVPYNSLLGANSGTVLTNSSVKGYSLSATVGLSMPSYHGFSGSFYYTYTDSKNTSDNPGSSASSAWGGSPSVNSPNEQILYNSQYSVPHRVMGSLSYKIEYFKHFATMISLFYNGSSTGRFSYVYVNDFNKDGINADLIYLPRKTTDLTFADIKSGTTVLFTASQQQEAFDLFIKENGLAKYRGKYLGRNEFLEPWRNRFDFRLLQDLFTNIAKHRNSLQFSVDIYNIGNMINKDWGIIQTENTAQQLLNVSSVTTAGVPTFTMRTITVDGKTVLPTTPFRNVSTNSTTWSLQLGLRYNF